MILFAACSKAPDEKAGKPLSSAKVAAEAEKLKLQPGEWETTAVITDMDVSGLPASATRAATGTPTTTRHCITPEQAARPDAKILSGTRDGHCSYQRFSMAGEKIDAAMTCTPPGAPGKMAMTLTGGYSPTAFAMGTTIKTDLPGNMAMTMKASVKGRRIGACATGAETAS